MNPPIFHRYGNDYLSAEEWGTLLRRDVRVARALGTEPLADARHLLIPLPVNTTLPQTAALNPADFIVRLTPATPRTVAETAPYFATAARAALDFPQVLAVLLSRTGDGSERAVPIHDAPSTARVLAVMLIWSLPDTLSIGNERELLSDLRGYLTETARIGLPFGMTVTALSDPADAARRAVSLCTLLRKVGRQTELRLLAHAGAWASRDVWRAVHGLGLVWGSMDLFHWFGTQSEQADTSQFRVLSSGNPPYFLPERAAEGERIPGLILEYDLPRSPDPVAVFDRMAIALSYLGATLGGRPTTATGVELDADALDSERDALENAVRTLADAGIAPGSDAARRFF